MGNSDLYIEAGSTINLTCIIQAESMRDTHIYWNYEGKVNICSWNMFSIIIVHSITIYYGSSWWNSKIKIIILVIESLLQERLNIFSQNS